LTLFFLVMFLRLKERLQPYKNPLLNFLEKKEHLTSIITFFGALFFVNVEISEVVRLIIFIFIVMANLWFIFTWIYAFCKTHSKYKRLQTISGLIGKAVVTKEVLRREDSFRSSQMQSPRVKPPSMGGDSEPVSPLGNIDKDDPIFQERSP